MTYDQSYMRSHYRDVFTIAMRCGENMAQNGAEAFRVEDTAIRILKTTGFAYAEAHVSVTGLILSLDGICADEACLDQIERGALT